ncbi:hypothetical protein ACQP3J_30870, partial [Escherichia coli]
AHYLDACCPHPSEAVSSIPNPYSSFWSAYGLGLCFLCSAHLSPSTSHRQTLGQALSHRQTSKSNRATYQIVSGDEWYLKEKKIE